MTRQPGPARMPRAIVIGCWVVALALGLVACGPSEPTATPVPPPATGTPTAAATSTAPATVAAPAPTATPAPPPPATHTPTPARSPAATIFDVTGSGGLICPPTGGASQCVAAGQGAPAFADDLVKTSAAPDGTIGLSAATTQLRLLPGSQLRLKSRDELSGAERFLLMAGQVLFDHEDPNGEVVIEAGAFRIQPVDTKFSIVLDAQGQITVGVFGLGTVVITDTRSTAGPAFVGADEQVSSAEGLHNDIVKPLSPRLRQPWLTYGVVKPEPSDTPAADLTATATPRPSATPTASATPDTAPPVITGVQAAPTAGAYGQCAGPPADVQIAATVRDPAGIGSVTLTYMYLGSGRAATPGPVHSLVMTQTITAARLPVYRATIPVGREAPGELRGAPGTLQYRIAAADKLGNQTTGATTRIPIVYCPPIR